MDKYLSSSAFQIIV